MWIDCHMHLSTQWSEPEQIKELIREYRQVVDHVWLLSVHGPYCLGNDAVLSTAKAHPDFFIPFALTDFDQPVEQVSAYQKKGFKGLKVLTANGPLGGDKAMPYYKEAERLHMPVFFHTGSVPAPDPLKPGFGVTMDYYPLELERIARVCPDLLMVAGHGGGYFWREALMSLFSSPNIYVTLGDFDSSAGMCVDNLASWDLAGLVEGRVLAGLDYPFAASICGKPEQIAPGALVFPAVEKMRALSIRLNQRLGPSWREAVMGDNARRFEKKAGLR